MPTDLRPAVSPPPEAPGAEAPRSTIGHYRWIICALLFFAATINYVDRQVIGLLKPTLQQEFGWSELDYGNIVKSFQVAYMIGMAASGWLMDRVGTRIGFSIAVIVWSLAAILHAEAPAIGAPLVALFAGVGLAWTPSVIGFSISRFLLAVGEAGNFPASIKTVAEWFPKRERALATGIFNAGTNVGVILTPLIVPPIVVYYGWYWAFVFTGVLGFLWLVAWLRYYGVPETHPRVSRDEFAHIRSDPAEPTQRIAWRRLLPLRQTWAVAAGKFLTDPVWWLYLFWVPDFLHRNHGLDLMSMGPPLIGIYLIADVGSVAGGWLSSHFLKRGWSPNRARKTAMFICAVSVTPIVFASQVSSVWAAVGLVGLAAGAHQAWSANIYTVASDMFPRQAVGSVIGLAGMAGALGGFFIADITSRLLETTGSYFIIFLVAGFAYLVALGCVHLLAPRLEPVDLR
ncbi:MAG: MFS transporter [Luteitalea sp.]|nr:MFS transporter [Luteitalea sp.]